MRVSREPEESLPVSRAWSAPRVRQGAASLVDRLVEQIIDAAQKGEAPTVVNLLARLPTVLGESGLTKYLDERLSTLTRSSWTPEVRVAALETLAISRERKGDLSGALSAIDDAFALDPSPELLSRFASLVARAQGPAEALDMINSRSAQWPDDPDLLAQAAILELDLGRPEKARDLLKAVLRDEPDHAEGLAAQARLAIVEKEPGTALEPARRLLVSQPPRARCLLVIALEMLGRGEEDPGLVTAVLENLPSDPWALHGLAHIMLGRSRPQDAVRVLTHILQLVPGDVDALRTRAYAYAVLGELSDAADDLDRAALVNDDAWLTSMRGEVARLQGDFPTAVKFFGRLSPEEAPPWMGAALAYSLLSMNDEAGARKAYKEALARNAEDIEALCGLAVLGLQDGGPDSLQTAEDLLHQALDIDEQEPRAHAFLGEVLRRQGREVSAIAEFDRALDLEPAYPWAQASKGQALLQLGRIDEGIDAIAGAALETPDEEWILDELVAALKEHQPDLADKMLRKLQRRVRESGGNILPICSRRASLAHQQQRWGDADALFAQARQLAPEDADLAATHVDVLRHLGQRAEALAVIDQLSPSVHDANLTRVRIDLLWSLGRLSEARPELEAMNAVDHPSAQVVGALGECYRLEGRRDEALALLSAANRREPDQPYVLASLGSLELDQDEAGEARQHLERAVQLMPKYEFALGRLVALELSEGKADAAGRIAEGLAGDHNPELVQVRAVALYGLGEYSRSVETLEDHFNDGGGGADLIRLRGTAALALGQQRDAARSFLQAAALDSPNSQLLESVISLTRVGLWTEALAAIDRAQARNDPFIEPALAGLYLRIGEWEEAARHARLGRDLLPMSAATAMVESRALRMQNLPSEALGPARFVQEIQPTDPWSIANLAECLLADDRADEARLAFRETGDRLNRRVHLHSDEVQLMGWCLLRLGKFNDASEVFLHSLTLTDQSAIALFNLLLASLLGGQHRQAEVLANRTIEELNVLSTASLRGALATAAHELAFVEQQLSPDGKKIADDLQGRIDFVLQKLEPKLDKLASMTLEDRNKLIYPT
jgi:tetratricopeptide (TPR) repeat protein